MKLTLTNGESRLFSAVINLALQDACMRPVDGEVRPVSFNAVHDLLRGRLDTYLRVMDHRPVGYIVKLIHYMWDTRDIEHYSHNYNVHRKENFRYNFTVVYCTVKDYVQISSEVVDAFQAVQKNNKDNSFR
jgi:hypothetical protein